MQILIYQSLWSELLLEDPMPLHEQREKYELTDDDFVRNVRAFIRNDEWDILMLYDQRYNRRAVPGGKVDKGYSLEEALEREIAEELGVSIRSIQYIAWRKAYMRGSKGINKRMAHYYDVHIHGTPYNKEADNAQELCFLKLQYDNDQHLTAVRVKDETFTERKVIYDIFPGLHTLVDVLPYMPHTPTESEKDPFILPDTIDSTKIYQQRYGTQTRKYFVSELQ